MRVPRLKFTEYHGYQPPTLYHLETRPHDSHLSIQAGPRQGEVWPHPGATSYVCTIVHFYVVSHHPHPAHPFFRILPPTLDPELGYFLSSSFSFEIICRSLPRFAPLSGRPFMTHCFVCSRWFGASPSIEKFHATAAIEAGPVWKGELRVLLLAGGSEAVPETRLVASYVKGMLACVVDCSQICRARSTSRRTGCEGKHRPAGRDYDQDVLIRAFSSSIGYSEGSCTAKSESRRCLDGSYEHADCINPGKDDHESEDEGVENDTGSEKHPQEEQGSEEKHAQVTNTNQVRELRIEAEGEDKKPGLQLCSDTSSCRVSTSDYATRMPAKSTERLLSNSRGTHLESVERALGRLTEAVTTEQGHSLSVRFGEGSGSVDHINNRGGRGKEPQLAERSSRSHEFFGERLGVVGSRDERGGVQLGLSSSWCDDLRGSEEQVSFQGEDTVECNTNKVEENDFEFDVEEFQTPRHGQKHDEPILETESLSEFHSRCDNSQGGRDRHSSPSATFESPQHETTLRTTTGSRLRSSPKESEDSLLPVDATAGGRKIPERLEAGAGRVGKGQENDLRGERHLRKSEALLTPYERRVRPRLDGPASTGRGEETEEASTKIVRPSRPSGGKDRHSKVNTAKGPRDRRVRLSVPTAVQFYDVQDRLGYDQPSKAVEWLIKKAKAAIDELGGLPARGNDGPSTLSDITHASPYPPSLGGPVSVSSSCPPGGSFSAALNSPFGDHVGNRMSYFIDSSSEQAVPFGNNPAHTRDVVGGIGLSNAHFVAAQGQLAGLSFPLGQTDLSRGSPGCVDGGKPGEFTGRVESRFKARERARERVKEKCTGRDCGKVAGGGSSPPSLQSSPLHQNSTHGPFPIQSSLQSSVHSLSLQNQHPSPLQSSISSVFNTTLSGIMQSSQQGTLQNLIMQNPSLQSPLPDQVQSSLQHPFQASFESNLQPTSQSMTSLPNPGMHQQSHLQRSSLEGCTQRTLHLGSAFTPGPCSSSFSEGASLSSSDFMSISSIPISHSLSMSELSSFGITSPSPIGPHLPTGNSAMIPLGFSPGPPASAFRPRPTASSQSCSESQPHPQDLSRPQILPPYNAAHVLASPGSSASSKASTSLYYAPTSSRMGSLQSVSPVQLESSSFSSIRNVSYNYQLLQMMSPGRASSSYQTSSSQLQMPARIQGLDDFDDELKSSQPSSPHVHP